MRVHNDDSGGGMIEDSVRGGRRYKKNTREGVWKSGANDRARTDDNRYHKPGLYQLSYVRQQDMLLLTIITKVKQKKYSFCFNKINILFAFCAYNIYK